MLKLTGWGRANWFYLVLPLLVLIAWNMHSDFPWQPHPRLAESAVLFDWCIFVPFIFWVCYRKTPWRPLIIRTLAIVSSGIWFSGKLIPYSVQSILRELTWLRSAGLIVVVCIEAVALIALLRVVFGKVPDHAEFDRLGVPPVLAKIMIAELRFWRWVGGKFSSRRSSHPERNNPMKSLDQNKYD